MLKLIIASSLILFWAFYEMSGGADFEPRERVAQTQAPFADTAPEAPPNAAAAIVETTVLAPDPSVAAEPIRVSSYVFVDEPVIISSRSVETEEAPAAPAPELRVVAGDRVNMRAGPGTQHPVLATLPRGTQAAFIEANDDGWVKIQLTADDQIGWMAARLLSDG
ncbi:SH3 domain-containing protein [Yoonia sp. BS5-3]|uniref:SH3 domain-containing protein n=1 Tax=Yoonia phaeophyticola TaxID=3137369 RepID=A0ABZ2V7Q2_9RHOB